MSGSEYLRSPAAFSKIAEFILLLAASIIMNQYNKYFSSKDTDVTRPDHMERLTFFLISAICVWLLVTLVFVFSLSGISDRIRNWNFLTVILSVLSATLLLLSSALLINEVTHLTNYPTPLGKIDLCESLTHAGKHTCGHLQVASFCGFAAMLLHIGDTALYYLKLSNDAR